MTSPSPYAVPLETLLAAHVEVAQQVQEQAEPATPYDAARWGGALPPALGDAGAAGGGAGGGCGAGGDCD